MPRKISAADAKDKWNFYFPKLLKLEMHKKLLNLGVQGKQSALLRSLVRLFVDGELDDTKIIKLIAEETYITPNGKPSKL